MMEYNGIKMRHEKKYFINTGTYHLIRARLKVALNLDKFGQGLYNEYVVSSVYFDDIFDSIYRDKESGILNRAKYRIRAYNYKHDNIRLEKKIKSDEYVGKIAVKLDYELYSSIIKGNTHAVLQHNSPLLNELYTKSRVILLRPKIIIEYDREAYTLPYENIRITFDKNLRAGFRDYDIFDETLVKSYILPDDIMILEVKFDSFLPTHIRKLLKYTQKDISSISKYVLCRNKQSLLEGKNLI